MTEYDNPKAIAYHSAPSAPSSVAAAPQSLTSRHPRNPSRYQGSVAGHPPLASSPNQPVPVRPPTPIPTFPGKNTYNYTQWAPPNRKKEAPSGSVVYPEAMAYQAPSVSAGSTIPPQTQQLVYPSGQWVIPSDPIPAAIQPPVTAHGPVDENSWFLEIYAKRHEITSTALRRTLSARDRFPLEVQLHDVLVGSLVPLTHQHRAHNADKIVEQAVSFFTSFEADAQWHVHVENLPHSIGSVIDGLTANSRNSDIGFRFMRFRFPYITFEWFLQTSYSQFVQGITYDGAVEVEFHWKAWSRTGAASGLAAYGTIKDTMKLIEKDGLDSLVIATRHFTVTQVFQPELMTPVSYPQGLPQLSQQGDVMLFTTSWTVIQFLRSSQIRMGFLIAISALFAALQPIVGRFSTSGGWVFAAIGVISGLTSVIAVIFGWFLTKVEANAARRRQDFDSH